MASTDARPVPRKNVAFRVTFPILDADGDLVTGAATLDSEVSKDGGAFADCTNEATEIATSSGVYYLDLTSTEMNADTVAVIVKTGTAGAKTTTIVLYPEESGDYRADVVQWNGTAVATPSVAGVPEVDVTHFNGTAGTFASGRPEVNTSHIAGAAVSTTTAQIGVNAVQISGDATAADNLENAYDDTAGPVPWQGILDQGTAQSAAAGDIQFRAAASFADDAIIGATVMALGSTQGYWQVRQITDYVSATDTATVSPNWAVTPSGTITYKVLASPPATSTPSDVNVVQISGDSAAADNLEAALDGTGGVTITAALTGNVTGNLSGSVGSVTGNVGGNVTGSVGSVASGGISSASFAAGAINAAAIAADAIGASELAADAVAEIADAVWDEAIAGHLGAGTTGAALNGATAPTAAAVADAVWDEALAGHAGAGSAGEALSAAGTAGDPWTTALPGAYGAGTAGYIIGTNVNATVSSRASQASLDTLDDYVDTEVAAIKAKTDNLPASPAATGDIPSAAAIADAVWDEDATAHQTQGTFGQAIGDPAADADSIWALVNTNLDATVSSRLATAGYTTPLDAAGVRSAVGLATNNLDTQLADLPTVAEFNARTIVAANYSTLTSAQVNAEVVDALATDTYAEPGQGTPSATLSLAAKLNYLYKAWRNKSTQTATEYALYADDATTVDQKAAVSDDTVTFTRGEVATGP